MADSLGCDVRFATRSSFAPCALNDMLPDDHQTRIVWKFVEGLDLSPIYEQIASVAGRPGHPAAASFRRKAILEELLVEAKQQVEALRSELEADPSLRPGRLTVVIGQLKCRQGRAEFGSRGCRD